MIIIDCTWNQTKKILKHPALKNLPNVIIDAKETTFWRFQEIDKFNLATIEALYYFVKDYTNCIKGEYNGEYDNILYFYAYKYKKLHE